MAEEIKFPLMVHFKVIAVDSPDLRAHLEIALCDLRIYDDLEPGRSSAAGKYITYNLSMTVHSLNQMTEIDQRLRAVEGVKMVL
jgi:putative lipoic acid-binding regulatory protein